MLYLMRKIGESIIINGDIEVRVVEVKGRTVKLGFEFPSTATVLRKEIHDRVMEENRAAAGALTAEDIVRAVSGLSLIPPEGAEKPKPKTPPVPKK